MLSIYIPKILKFIKMSIPYHILKTFQTILKKKNFWKKFIYYLWLSNRGQKCHKWPYRYLLSEHISYWRHSSDFLKIIIFYLFHINCVNANFALKTSKNCSNCFKDIPYNLKLNVTYIGKTGAKLKNYQLFGHI